MSYGRSGLIKKFFRRIAIYRAEPRKAPVNQPPGRLSVTSVTYGAVGYARMVPAWKNTYKETAPEIQRKIDEIQDRIFPPK
jgi:hypothetical protein